MRKYHLFVSTCGMSAKEESKREFASVWAFKKPSKTTKIEQKWFFFSVTAMVGGDSTGVSAAV